MDAQLEGSSEFLLEIGRLVTAAAYAETFLDTVIQWILEPRFESGGEIITADMDFKKKANMVRTLIAEHPKPTNELKKVRRLAGELMTLYDKRNDFIHGIWEKSLIRGRRRLTRASARDGQLVVVRKPVVASDIKVVADRIVGCADELEKALFQHLLG
jgi:hypothetical protein